MSYKERQRERRKVILKLIGILLVLFAMALFLNWSNKSLVLTQYTFSHDDLPEAFDGYRIVQVSDLQSEYFGENQENLLGMVRGSKPDVIVFTGDLLDRNHTDYEAARVAMKGLVELAPVYYVNGNHEMALREEIISAFYKELESMGVHVLFDRAVSIEKDGERVWFLGLSEHTMFSCKGNARSNRIRGDETMLKYALEQLEGPVGEGGFAVLLTHEPQYLDVYASEKIDLAFAGHAHGGQIRLPFTDGLFAPGQGVLPKMTSGMHTSGTTTMVVSRGLGNSTFPFRVFNRPEVVVVELQRLGKI